MAIPQEVFYLLSMNFPVMYQKQIWISMFAHPVEPVNCVEAVDVRGHVQTIIGKINVIVTLSLSLIHI